MEADPDAELMLQVASGDQAAFAALFDRHAQSVARFAYRFVGDAARAEELAQDIFVKVYRNARAYKPSAKFKTFLFKVAANHCLNEVRRGEYRVKHTTHEAEAEATGQELPEAAASSPDEALHGKELERAVGEAMSQMTERERAAFTMCRFEGMAYREIAEALAASEAAVKSLIHRATMAVARKLSSLEAGAVPARSQA
ncbi:MAG TPA: sigma-70 family RNA polymerase sigma factor [Myxococcales bacterium]|nr:sigma-70 family RNA polymerase sigma factor [Myxococcales bacterium]